MEEVVGQSCDASVHTATSITGIHSSEAIGDVDAQKPVTEADGCFAKSWESTEKSYEREQRDNDHQNDGVAKSDHDKLQLRLILSTSESLLACEVQEGRHNWHVIRPEMESFGFACRRVPSCRPAKLTQSATTASYLYSRLLYRMDPCVFTTDI